MARYSQDITADWLGVWLSVPRFIVHVAFDNQKVTATPPTFGLNRLEPAFGSSGVHGGLGCRLFISFRCKCFSEKYPFFGTIPTSRSRTTLLIGRDLFCAVFGWSSSF